MINNIENLLEIAIQEAEAAIERNDEPYGAVIADKEGNIISSSGNMENTTFNIVGHAEILAIQKACRKLHKKDLKGLIMVTNYKPCCMCASAILMSGIEHVYVGSNFQGFDELFLEAVTKIKSHGYEFKQEGIAHERCFKQVTRGRKKLQGIEGYSSSHLNGIL